MSVVLITGGTGAIGAALVEEFSRTDDVAFTYFNNEERARKLSEKFHAFPVKMDISDKNLVQIFLALRRMIFFRIFYNMAGY